MSEPTGKMWEEAAGELYGLFHLPSYNDKLVPNEQWLKEFLLSTDVFDSVRGNG
jgi:hypothetical protein